MRDGKRFWIGSEVAYMAGNVEMAGMVDAITGDTARVLITSRNGDEMAPVYAGVPVSQLYPITTDGRPAEMPDVDAPIRARISRIEAERRAVLPLYRGARDTGRRELVDAYASVLTLLHRDQMAMHATLTTYEKEGED
jgi:hypothetical protein